MLDKLAARIQNPEMRLGVFATKDRDGVIELYADPRRR
jgi:hypothetical protein